MSRVLALIAALLLTAGFLAIPHQVQAHHPMCDSRVEMRTQTVSIDPDLEAVGLTHTDVLNAFDPWNQLFLKHHGFPIFTAHDGDWLGADILLTAQGTSRTWVATRCSADFVQRGANHSIVFLGIEDAWRNKDFLPHELGHALGFADHGVPASHSHSHVGYAECSPGYLGVMSYCSSRQYWFLQYDLPGTTFDDQLVERYWPGDA